jgi:hypothetical protein
VFDFIQVESGVQQKAGAIQTAAKQGGLSADMVEGQRAEPTISRQHAQTDCRAEGAPKMIGEGQHYTFGDAAGSRGEDYPLKGCKSGTGWKVRGA